jgi:ferredoxin-NADP reductase
MPTSGRSGRGRLALTVTRGDVRPRANGGPEVGRLDSARLAPFVRAAPHVHCFVCGPPAFVDDLVQALSHLGVPADRIRREGW